MTTKWGMRCRHPDATYCESNGGCERGGVATAEDRSQRWWTAKIGTPDGEGTQACSSFRGDERRVEEIKKCLRSTDEPLPIHQAHGNGRGEDD